jgi:CheY-like chemotaxis protein
LSALKNKTVLVVDDEPVVARYAQTVLERAGYTVMTAFDGQDALQYCQRHDGAIDVLLTDIQMPRLNGLQLAQCLVDHKLNVPVLFMTGYKSDSELKGELRAVKGMGGQTLLQKPFTPARLLVVIEQALQPKT